MSAHPNPDEVIDVEIDYITATSHQRSATNGLASFGSWMVAEEVQRGCKDSSWRATGYHGRHAGGTAFGVGAQGCIVRASSRCAREHWRQLLTLADNVTRLDVQVTVRPVAGPTATLSRHHKELLKAPRGRGKEVKFHAWYGPAGIESIEIGKRVSDRFGRVYDKGLQSGLVEWQGCLRYEVELHRHLALRTALLLDSQEQDQAEMLSQVHTFMSVRGLRLGFSPQPAARSAVNDALELRPRRSVTSAFDHPPEVVRVLRWLANSVRPSVQRLIESGYGEEVSRALGTAPALMTWAWESSPFQPPTEEVN